METNNLSVLIVNFLQPSAKFAKSYRNHISYVHSVINSVLRKYFNVNRIFTHEEIINVFVSLGYKVAHTDEMWTSGHNPPKQSIHINVDTKKLLALRLTRGKMAKNTNDAKRNEIEKLISKLVLASSQNS